MFKRKNNKKGFTVVELTIVVSVIAILSAVLIPTFAGITKKARQTADEAAVRELNNVIATADKDITDVNDLIAYLETNNIAADSYVPMSKGYSFVWNTNDDKVMLYSEKDKAIVFPKEYVGKSVEYVTLVKEDVEEIVTAENATDVTNVANNGGVVAFNKDLTLNSTIEVKKDLVVDLTATLKNDVANDDDSNGVFYVEDATLTLNGSGTVNGVTNSNYNMAIWANGGDIVINGGIYTNVGATDDGDNSQHDLIYVKNGGKITINGGTFICETVDWTLNAKDDVPGSIIVKGGEFYEFDPSNTLKVRTKNATKNGIVIPEGYKVEAFTKEGVTGTWYRVVKV